MDLYNYIKQRKCGYTHVGLLTMSKCILTAHMHKSHTSSGILQLFGQRWKAQYQTLKWKLNFPSGRSKIFTWQMRVKKFTSEAYVICEDTW